MSPPELRWAVASYRMLAQTWKLLTWQVDRAARLLTNANGCKQCLSDLSPPPTVFGRKRFTEQPVFLYAANNHLIHFRPSGQGLPLAFPLIIEDWAAESLYDKDYRQAVPPQSAYHTEFTLPRPMPVGTSPVTGDSLIYRWEEDSWACSGGPADLLAMVTLLLFRHHGGKHVYLLEPDRQAQWLDAYSFIEHFIPVYPDCSERVRLSFSIAKDRADYCRTRRKEDV